MSRPVAVQTDAAPRPSGPYSQGVRAGSLLFLAGQAPITPDGTLLGDASFDEQAHQVFRNLEAVAQAAGTSLRHAVRVGAFLTDLGNFAAFNRIYAEYLGDAKPARTTVQSPLPGFEIEVDAVVWVPGD